MKGGFSSAHSDLFLGIVDDPKPEQQQEVVRRNGFLQEGQSGFAETGADFEYRMIGERDDVAPAVAEVGEGNEIREHRLTAERNSHEAEAASLCRAASRTD